MNTREFNRDYLADCESRVSIEENLTDRTNLSDTLTGGLLVACESRVQTENVFTDRTNLL